MKTLKHEEVLVRHYETMRDVLEQVPRSLEGVYNRQRLHSALGYLPPEEFKQTHDRRGVSS